jgi:hypothetical protein
VTFLLAAALIGSVLTAAFMVQFGALVAILSMPLGGSLSVLMAGLCLAARRGPDDPEGLERPKPSLKKAA